MKNRSAVLIIIFVLFTIGSAQEEYPNFSKEYWQNEQELAQGKMTRGAALGISGLILIWPTAILISRSKDNPRKYIPISIAMGAASIGAMAHGFASIRHGKKQKATATEWVEQYTNNPGSVDRSAEQDDYINAQLQSAHKTTIFGAYTVSIATLLLTNGIIQSTRSDEDVTTDDITIWPYYAAGGVLISTGIWSIIKSQKKKVSIDELAATSTTSSTAKPQFIPFVTITPKGKPMFGAFYSMNF